jgi:cellulose synthase/poly-beta-1,6-N-acetylglucosamine synthase-like glycosyltransferase
MLRRPGKSAVRALTEGQQRVFAQALAVAGIAGLIAPAAVCAFAGLAGILLFALVLSFRIWLNVNSFAAAPAAQLDVKLLIEAGDEATAFALRRQRWPEGAELLVVPPGLPRTKPRALNYGLVRARGEFIVVYDAEDRPHPDQYAGRDEQSFLARGWDAWNVTEDADLDLRPAHKGLTVSMIAPPTLEVPPEGLPVWINQRSRWLKDFLQTWLAVMRRPVEAVREMGLAGFVSMQLTPGAAILSAPVLGPWAVWLALYALVPCLAKGPAFVTLAAVSYEARIAMALWARGRKDWRRWVLAVSLPLYWPLQSAAMVQTFSGLARRPHSRAKTPHRVA